MAGPCPNCGARTAGDFCANCGQETRLALPTFRAFMREAAGRYVALDGRLWRTLFALVARPGFLTLEYFAGRRKRYIRPARLFLVLYLLLFAVIGVLQSPSDVADQVVFVDTDSTSSDGRTAPAAPKSRDPERAAGGAPPKAIIGEGETSLLGLDDDFDLTLRLRGVDVPLPSWLRQRYDHFKKLPREEKAERLYAGVLRYGTYAVIVLLPAFALLLMLAYVGRANRYPGRPHRYAEHLVYSAHLHAFAALMLILLLLVPWAPARWAIGIWIVYYVMRARQTVYRGRWWGGALRAMAIAAFYLFLIAFAMLGLVAVAALVR